MKKLAISVFTIFLSLSVFSQDNRTTDEATAATKVLTDFFKLDDNQVPEVQSIQERKYRNLGEIESLKSSDPDMYILKMRSIRTGTVASYGKVLTKAQKVNLNQKKIANRTAVAEIYIEMKEESLTKAEMQSRIIEMEFEMLQNL